jgi:hypothetical protein
MEGLVNSDMTQSGRRSGHDEHDIWSGEEVVG